MTRTALLLAGCGVLGTLAACTSGSPPPPRLSPPIVGDPLDLSRIAATPCDLATADILAQYHLTAPGTETTTTTGPACTWTARTTALPNYQAGVDLHSGGLEALYHRRAAIPVFQPTAVSEYPAVNTAASRDAVRHGQCTVQVGVANDTLLVVSVIYTDPHAVDYTDPCPDADTFAASLLGHAEGKAP